MSEPSADSPKTITTEHASTTASAGEAVEADIGHGMEVYDGETSGVEKYVLEVRELANEPECIKTLAPPLLGDDSADCDCWPERKPCGITAETTSTDSECRCATNDHLVKVGANQLDNAQTQRFSDKMKDTNSYDDVTSAKDGKRAKFTFDLKPFENSGKLQSPIAINLGALEVINYPALSFSSMHQEYSDRIFAVLTNHYEVHLKYTIYASPRISGGPLNRPYKFNKFVFHWGTDDDKGSEHTIDGKAFAMELHAVYIQENLTKLNAVAHADGYAILGYFFEVGNNDNPVISELLDTFQRLDQVQVPNYEYPYIDHHRPFAVNDLIEPFSESYITYRGSMTSEPYLENVTWILAPYTITMSTAQMARFRSLKGVKPNSLRELQDRNDRVINIVQRKDNIFRVIEKK